MAYRVVLFAPDRGMVYDGRTPGSTGVGGGVTARLSLVTALAALGHQVTAYVNCLEPVQFGGVQYLPLDRATDMSADVFIAITTGGDLSFAPLRRAKVEASLKIVWVQGVPHPTDLDAVSADYVYVASNFLRDVCVDRWGIAADRIFVCYNGLNQDAFAAAEARALPRDPFALAYIGPQEKGLAASLEILRRLRAHDDRYHLDVLGGNRLWGMADDPAPADPGVTFCGMVGQDALVPRLFGYEYGLAPQAMEEGFGIAVQEARRAGVIVFASAVGAFRELIHSGEDGFLIDEPHMSHASHDAIANLILGLADDPARRARLRQSAARTPWSWALAARTWQAHWDHVLDRSRPSPVTSAGSETWLELPDGWHSEATGYYRPRADPLSGMPIEPAAQRVLIAGYYGHGNLGDEAILRVMLDQLRQALPNISATVASGDPESTRATYGVDAVNERDWPALIDAAGRSDLIILGGGGLFQDYFGVDEGTMLSRRHWGLTLFAAFPALATLTNTKFMVYAAGVGPLATPEGRRYTRLIFERADAATVRDPGSLALLTAIGVPTSEIDVAPDPAFCTEPASPDRASALLWPSAETPGASCLVAVAVRHWEIGIGREGWQAQVAIALDRFVEAHNAGVVFVPFQSRHEHDLTDDESAADRIRGFMQHGNAVRKLPADLSPSDVQSVLAASGLVLAMRLHAVILAANAGVPIVALAYDPKVSAAMAELGVGEYALDLSAATADAVFDRLSRAYVARESLRHQLATTAADLRSASTRHTSRAVALLRSCPSGPRASSPEWTGLLSKTLLDQISRAEASETSVERLTAQLDAQARDHEGTDPARLVADAGPGTTVQTIGNESPLEPGEAAARRLARLLDERTQELLILAAKLSTAEYAIAQRPGHTLRRVRRGTRALASGVFGAVSTIGGPPFRLAQAIYQTLLPERTRATVRTAVSRALLMNWRAYVFDRFKRVRVGVYGRSFSRLRAPGEAALVSIVLPAYNGAGLIREAVDSVLKQTYSNFELIIVDDGSTDDTPRIIDDYARQDTRVRVVHQENRTLPRALSRGFRMARGEFLTWTSCDNRMKPAFLGRMVDGLRRHPAWDVAYANLDMIGEDGRPLRNTRFYDDSQYPPGSEHVHLPPTTAELNVRANNSVGAAFLYRSRVAHLLGDYSQFRFLMEDYDYWLRSNALMTVRHVDFDEPIYEYRFHSQSLTARWEEHEMRRSRDRLMVFEDFRRDAYLGPLLWIIDGNSLGIIAALRDRVRAAGHGLYEGEYPLSDRPRFGAPAAYVRVLDSWPDASSDPDGLPDGTLRVLVVTSGDLPAQVSDRWDACFTIGEGSELPRLAKDYQGWLSAGDVDTLFHAVDVRAKSCHLERIEALVEVPEPTTLDASVVICTRALSERLIRAVQSVARQQTTRAFEVLVVNNGPDDRALHATIDRLREEHEYFWLRPERLRLLACPVSGLSAARNTGIGEARGDVVCFLDDDARASETWLTQVCDAFGRHPATGVIGGHITLEIPEPRPAALLPGWEKHWSQYVTEYTGYTEVEDWRRFPWGANWSARRAALLRIGGFRSQYGRTGQDFSGGEELVAACLIQRLGYRIAVVPQATVVHDVDPARFTFDHVRRTIAAGYQVGHRARRDLYLPRGTGPARALTLLATHHVDRTVPAGRGRWRDAAYQKLGQIRVLGAELADVLRRSRQPIVAARS